MAHTLTWPSSATVTANGTTITSPYTLKNGDTIVVSWTSSSLYPFVNNSQVNSGTVLDLADTDIEVTLQAMGGGGI